MADESIPRLYYSISEVSKRFGLKPHVLRFWETEFEQLRPRKNRAGRRVYTEADIQVVERIVHLLRIDKYTLEGARQVLARPDASNGLSEAERETLLEMRSFMVKVLKSL